LCCSKDRLEEIEGDLQELYLGLQRHDDRRANLHYAREVIAVCARQLARRSWRTATRSRRIGAIDLYPLRIVATLLGMALIVGALQLPTDNPLQIVARIFLGLTMTVGVPCGRSSHRRQPAND